MVQTKEERDRKRREYEQRPEVKERRRIADRKRSQRPEVKERIRKYRQRPEVKERKRKYNQKPDIKEKARKRTKRWVKNHPDINKWRRESYWENHTARKASQKRTYQKYREKYNKNEMVKYFEIRNFVFEKYSKGVPKCACCGVKGIEFLALDHINGRRQMDSEPELKKIGYSSKLANKQLLTWLKNNNFPKGFQILCHNCNFAKGVLGICPHQE